MRVFDRLFGRKRSSAGTATPRVELDWEIREDDTAPPLIYAVGDVHGCLVHLRRLEALIFEDARHRHEPWQMPVRIVMMGDYIDRGTESRGVIEHLTTPMPEGFSRICIGGNHEEMMLDYLELPTSDHIWLVNGGMSTLLSYGLDGNAAQSGRAVPREILNALIPEKHIAFLKSLTLIQQYGNLVFAHAGIDRQRALRDQERHEVLWKRNDAAEDTPPLVVVHGHIPGPEVRATPYRIQVDTGAFASGRLSAARFVDGRFDGVVHT